MKKCRLCIVLCLCLLLGVGVYKVTPALAENEVESPADDYVYQYGSDTVESSEDSYEYHAPAASTEPVQKVEQAPEEKDVGADIIQFLLDNAIDIGLLVVILIALVIIGHKRNQIAET